MTPGGARSTGSLDRKLREYARTRDPVLRDEIISAHLGLVNQVARRFSYRGEPVEDLVQAGSIGLLEALERFDPDLGFEFAAFASKTIIGEVKRHFRDKGWAVRAPRRIQELYLRVGTSVGELSQTLGRPPTISELAADAGSSEQEVIEAMEAGHAYRPASIDAPGLDDETMASRLGAIDPVLAFSDDRLNLRSHLDRLPPRERLILELRYSDDLTQSEIAERVGISQMHVSRLIARSLASLRAAYAAEA